MIGWLMQRLGWNGGAERGSRLRENPLTPLEREFLPPVLEIQESPPSPVKQNLLVTLVLLTFALLLWSYLGKIDVVSTATGKLIPDGKVKAVQSLETAIVRNILVREGQKVHKGDLLVELDSTASLADLDANQRKWVLSELEQERLRAELAGRAPRYASPQADREMIALQERLRVARRSAYQAKLQESQQALEEKSAQLASALAILAKLRQVHEILQEKESSARPLVELGAVSRMDYLQIRQDLVSNENDLTAQEHTVIQARHAEQEAEQKIHEVQQDDQSTILADLENHSGMVAERSAGFIKSRRQVEQEQLRAPVDGTVQSVNIGTVGGVVTPSQPLVVIVPNETPLIVEATLSNEEVGFVKVGQKVDIKVDSYPFQKYGMLPGTLIWISPDAEETQSASFTPDSGSLKTPPGPTGKEKIGYKVHVKPELQYLNSGSERKLLLAGMTVEADIITERRRVIDFFLSPINKYVSEGMRVR